MNTETEICYKCGGDGGEQISDGWIPYYRCSTTGKLPLGSLAAVCKKCDGHGNVSYVHPDDGDQRWYKCEFCGNGAPTRRTK